MSTEDVEAVFRRTQQNALFAPAVPPIVVDRPPVSPVKPEVVSNVISLAAQHETRIKAAQDEAMTEQDLREADARGAVSAAHGPDIDTLLQDIGYAPAA